MANLHLISKHTNQNDLLSMLARCASKNDQLLFIANSVTGLVNSDLHHLIDSNFELFALKADINCRGIAHLIPTYINQIDDERMVKLTTDCNKVISW